MARTAVNPTAGKPKVLLATTCRWFPTARLAMALAGAGCAVEAVCPSGHPMARTSAVDRMHDYRGLAPLRSFAQAIACANPDLIVPADDLATWHLQELYHRELSSAKNGTLNALIERSLGAAESFPLLYARSAFIALAREEGIRAPQAEVIPDIPELERWIARTGLPTVLKADGTSGGDGVRIVHTLDEAQQAWRKLKAPPLIARAAKRALVDHDDTLIWPSLLRHRSLVNAQSFVSGREATSTIACWKGAVLASLHFEVVTKVSSAGHATVMRVIENAEMSDAVERLARRLGLSGFYGFDFMIESGTGDAYVIEINPRATQVGHLTLGPGCDLSAALYAALSGQAVKEAPKITEKDTIALFPQEWIRDSQSPFLQSAYHDVPWEEPELVRECVDSRRQQSAWYSRLNRKQAISATASLKAAASISASLPAQAKSHGVGMDWRGK